MNQSSKLKPDNFLVNIIIFTVFAIALLVGLYVTKIINDSILHIGQSILYTLVAALFALAYIKIKNSNLLIFMMWYLNNALLNYAMETDKGYFTIILVVTIVPLTILFFYKLFSKEMQPPYRQILELAAKPVKDAKDGFTSRPYAAGDANFTKDEIINFAKFLTKQFIVSSYFEKHRVVLVISSYNLISLFFIKPDFSKKTYIAFDFSGNITVNIAKQEYQKYRDELTFDQLCDSFGNLMRRFLSYFNNGKKELIIQEIEEEMSRSHAFFKKLSVPGPIETEINEGE